MTEQMDADVIIIGAGMAGLMAARTVAERGLRTLLVEARERIGGRIQTLHPAHATSPVELGAEFIHGRPPDLLSLIQEASLHLVEVEGTNYCEQDGRVQNCPGNETFHVLDQLKDYTGPDTSFAAHLRRENIRDRTARQARDFVEGFNAADADKISILALAAQQRAEDAIEGDRAFHLEEGYAALTAFVHRCFAGAGGQTMLATRIHQVQWRRGCAEFTATGLQGALVRLTASQAIVTLPLGVLQNKLVTFLPEPASLSAASLMAAGHVHRLVLVFKERFWATEDQPFGDMSFLFTPDGVPGVWWTRFPSKASVLTAWMGGSRAHEISASRFLDRALESLADIFQVPLSQLRQQLLSFHLHDWTADPLSSGAYSYVIEGGINASRQLSVPVEDTLYFAGEHTDVSGHWGTVHGALRSGVRAAGQLLSARSQSHGHYTRCPV